MKKPIALAIITETFPPEVNGVARTIGIMVVGLATRQYRVQVYRPRQPGEVGKEIHGAYKSVLLPGLVLPFYPEVRMGLPLYRFFLKNWRKQRPDLVHVVTEGPLGWAAVRAARRLNLPVVSDFHTNFHTYSDYYKMGVSRHFVNGYLRRFHNRTLCTMVPTKALKKAMEANGYLRLRVVGRGVDTALFNPKRRHQGLRESWGARPDDLVCLYVGRLAAEKNIHLVIEAFEAIRATTPRARLVLVGDGPMREKIRQKWPGALTVGVRRGESLARHYASADIFLFPSLSETFGNVTMEAMASGLAVLAFDDAAAGTYIQDGVSGKLVSPDRLQGFAEQAACLGKNPDIWRSFGEHARVVAKRCTWEKVIDDLEAVFAEACLWRGESLCRAIG